MTPVQREALERLISIAKRDTGGSRRVADFLLAWWNSAECGKFDLTELWGVSPDVASDMVTIFAFISKIHSYPDSLGYEKDFAEIIAAWRPELAVAKR